MIIHTVTFRTKHQSGSEEESGFIEAGMALGNLSMVNNFQCYKQVGTKNDFDFGFSMEFGSQKDYEAYNRHPEHVRFVEAKWTSEIEDFIEIDYVKYAAT